MEVDNLNQTYQTLKNFRRYATPQKNTEIVVKTEQVDEAEEVIEIKDSTDMKIEPAEIVDATATTSDAKPEVKKKKRKAAAVDEKKAKKRQEKKAKLEAELEANTQKLAIIKKFKNINK